MLHTLQETIYIPKNWYLINIGYEKEKEKDQKKIKN